MYYKKWIISLSLIVASAYLLLAILYIAVDPEQFFNHSLTKYKFRYTNYYSKYQFEKLKSSRYSLVFGTSRSLKISTEAQVSPFLNFHNLYGEPAEVLNFLQQLDDKQIKNINTVYFLVSINTMVAEEKELLDYSRNTFIDKLHAAFPLNMLKLKYLLKDITINLFNKTTDFYIAEDGSKFVYDKNISSIIPRNSNTEVKTRSYHNQAIDELLEINKLCKDRNISIVYYTPTYSDQHLADFPLPDLKKMWKQLFNGGIEGFYALYYLEGISNIHERDRYPFFTDSSHLNYSMMNSAFKYNVVMKNKKYYVTPNNLDDYFHENSNAKFQRLISKD